MKSIRSAIIIIIILVISVPSTLAQSGDFLNEVGIQAVPDGMTFEEYRDANRRLLPAVLISSAIPIPGMMHFQAGEKKTGRMLAGVAALSGLAIISGIASMEEGDEYRDTEYGFVDIDNVRYEKIPILIYDDNGVENNAYELRELHKKQELSGAGVFLIATGALLLVSDYVYDWWHGIDTIQMKRDRVRYKYGQQMRFGMAPIYSPENGTAGVQLAFTF